MTPHQPTATPIPRRPGRARHEDRREAIIEAATEAFYRHGYGGASLRDIARQAGITQATVYYHFKNKEEILLTIITEFSDQLFQALLSALARDADPVARLRHAIERHILFTKTHRREVKIILEDKKFLGEALNARVKEKERAIFSLYRSYLQELQRTGLIRDGDLIPTTFSLFGVINSLYHWYRPEKPLTIERIAGELADLLLNGLLRRPAAVGAPSQGGERC
jgi:AcrR family transcriptional regulator